MFSLTPSDRFYLYQHYIHMDLSNYTTFAKNSRYRSDKCVGCHHSIREHCITHFEDMALLFSVKNGEAICLFCLLPISQAKRGREWDF